MKYLYFAGSWAAFVCCICVLAWIMGRFSVSVWSVFAVVHVAGLGAILSGNLLALGIIRSRK